LYLLLGLFLFFAFFIFLITRPSTQSTAKGELEICVNIPEVKSVWDKFKPELHDDEEFILEVRKKLDTFKPDETQVIECIAWLPQAPTSVNIVIIPDLSRRITDQVNNPDQVKNDTILLHAAWSSFVENFKLGVDTKHKLIVDVTDINQAKGQFGKVANNLQFDLAKHKGKSNRLYFTHQTDLMFLNSIKNMYASAVQLPLGADYRFYFKRYLEDRLKKPTLFDNFINKLIIITDGYMEAQGKYADTKIYGFETQLRLAVSKNNVLQEITELGFNIPKENVDLSNTEILICEVNDRKMGKGYDYEILKTYWTEWLGRMNVKKLLFLQREQALDITRQKLNDFIKI